MEVEKAKEERESREEEMEYNDQRELELLKGLKK